VKVISRENLQGLVDCGIVQLRGVSGAPTDVETAVQAPKLVEIHAMSGLVFRICGFDAETDQFTTEPA